MEKAEKQLRKFCSSPKDLAAMRVYEQGRSWADPSLKEKLYTIRNLTQQLLEELGEE